MIIYAVIGRETDGAVLVERSAPGAEGNFPQIASQLLAALRDDPNLVPSGNRKTFALRADVGGGGGDDGGMGWLGCDAGCDAGAVFGGAFDGLGPPLSWSSDPGIDHFFHVLRGEGAYYVCLSDDSGRQQGVNFRFLHDLEGEFARAYSPHRVKKADAYGMDKGFGGAMRELVHHYNTNRTAMGTDTKVLELSAEVDQLKRVMGINIEMMLNRGEMLDNLVEKSEQANQDARVFHKRSNMLKKDMRGNKFKWSLIIAGVVVGLLALLLLSICGPTFDRCRFHSGAEGEG